MKTLQSSFAERRVFFMHVPKTGGISFSNVLRDAFQPQDVCPPSAGGGLWKHAPADVTQYKLFVGHFGADFIDAVDESAFRITVLRDPRERVVSLYDFWRSIPPEWSSTLRDGDIDAPAFARSVTFTEFLHSDVHWLRANISNSTALQLIDTTYHLFSHDEDAVMREAARKLSRFDLAITTHDLTKAIHWLCNELQISVPEAPLIHANQSQHAKSRGVPRPRTRPTAVDLARIDDLNRVDAELYKMIAQQDAAWRHGTPASQVRKADAQSKLKRVLSRFAR